MRDLNKSKLLAIQKTNEGKKTPGQTGRKMQIGLNNSDLFEVDYKD